MHPFRYALMQSSSSAVFQQADAGGGSNNQNQNNDTVSGGDDTTKGGGEKNFLDENDDLWDDGNESGDDTDGGDGDNNTDAVLAANRKKLQDYIDSVDFGLKIDAKQLQTALDSGDAKDVVASLNGGMRNLYGKVLGDISKLLNSAEKRMKSMVDEISTSNISARESEISLLSAVPAAKNKALKPMAMAYKARFLKKGLSDDEANKKVQKLFKTIRDADAADFGVEDDEGDITTPPAKKRKSKGDVEDWAALLGS